MDSTESIVKQKVVDLYAEHILRGFSGSNALLASEGKFEGNKATRRHTRTWNDKL